MSTILGIDPGTKCMGWGIIREENGTDRVEVVAYGVLKANPGFTLGERLKNLFSELEQIIVNYHPDEVAVEEPYIAKNPRTALMAGRAQGIALLAAARYNLPVFHYTPALIRQRVTSFGGSDKIQVQEALRLQLGLKARPEPLDASDALATALCHLHESSLSRIRNIAGQV